MSEPLMGEVDKISERGPDLSAVKVSAVLVRERNAFLEERNDLLALLREARFWVAAQAWRDDALGLLNRIDAYLKEMEE